MKHVLITALIFAAFVPTQPAGAQPQRPAAESDQTLALQVALDRAGFSPGEIDGRAGANTTNALRALQEAHGLTPSGEPDEQTIQQLGEAYANPLSTYTITAEDVAEPFVKQIPGDMLEKAALDRLGYATIREMLAERFHMSPALLERLNPDAKFVQGEQITVLNVEPFLAWAPKAADKVSTDAVRADDANAKDQRPVARAAGRGEKDAAASTTGERADAMITVTDKTKSLTVTDVSGKVVFHAPVTVGSTRDPLPVGEWEINGVHRNPVYNYNPDLFWDADASHTKAKIAPGPNNPVGSVWIDLSKEHYGIHGTPEPSRIGHTESHGCIRLTNWDAMRLAEMVAPGMKVVLR